MCDEVLDLTMERRLNALQLQLKCKEDAFEAALDKIRELSKEIAQLEEALRKKENSDD